MKYTFQKNMRVQVKRTIETVIEADTEEEAKEKLDDADREIIEEFDEYTVKEGERELEQEK